MRLYRITYYEEDIGWRNEWFGSKASANARRHELQGIAHGDTVMEAEALDVPLTKDELVRWLNNYACGDEN